MQRLTTKTWVLILVLLTLATSATVFADGKLTGEFIEQREYKQIEWVEFEQGGHSTQIPVEVHHMERDYRVDINDYRTSVTVTMAHTISSQRHDGSGCWRFTVWSGARTETDQCVEKVWAKGSTVKGGTESTGNSGQDWWGCKDDSGMQTDSSTWAQGQTVKTRGDHEIKVNGTTYQWLDQDYPSQNLPYEPQCTG